jgi:hypothetical protein
VLNPLLAQIAVTDLDLGLDVVIRRAGDRDAAGIGELLQSVGDVDAVAMDVVALDDHVAEIDAHAVDEALVSRDSRVALGLAALGLDRAAFGIHHAMELDQQGITHGLHQAAVMDGDGWLENLV